MYYAVVGAFLFGIATQTIFPVSLPTMAWLAMLVFVVAVLARKHGGTMFARQHTIVAWCLLAAVLGLLRTEVHTWNFGDSSLEAQVGKEISLSGVVIKEPDVRERLQHVYVETGNDTVLVTTDRALPLTYGDELFVQGELGKPESFTTDLGRTFDYQNYLRAKGVEYQIPFADISVLSTDNASSFLSFLLTQKHRLMEGIEAALPEPQAGLGEGLLLGVKRALGDSLEQDFRTTGIIHIVVLSGYNIMLVIAFVLFALGFFFRPKAQAVCAIAAVVCFALIVGLSATVVRASIMAVLLLLAMLFGKNYHVLRALFLAGLVMVFINPFILLYDVGFQLSFMATLGLILIVPQFETLAARMPNSIGLREFLLATIATQIAVLPLLLYHIGEVSLVAIVVNMLVLPVVPLAMFLTFVAGLLALLSGTVAGVVGMLAYAVLNYIIVVAQTFAAVPFAAVSVPAFSGWWLPVFYAIPIMGYVWYQQRKRTRNDVSDWEVVEEQALSKSAGSYNPALENNKPVFFR